MLPHQRHIREYQRNLELIAKHNFHHDPFCSQHTQTPTSHKRKSKSRTRKAGKYKDEGLKGKSDIERKLAVYWDNFKEWISRVLCSPHTYTPPPPQPVKRVQALQKCGNCILLATASLKGHCHPTRRRPQMMTHGERLHMECHGNRHNF